MSLEKGKQLGPYEIVEPLGAGGMGEVYKARDTRLDRTVAIKVLPERLASNPDLRQRFEREARSISSLNHPHICVLYDIGQQDGTEYLVMEFLEGETLARRLTRGALPIGEAVNHAIQIADALDKAHRQGIVHRDLKPGNIMLTKSGAKLLDFGLAKLRETAGGTGGLSMLPTQASLTAEGTILGTFQYMAPEQLEGREADARTDLFAFGAVLYEMLTARKAFEGRSQASLIGSILKDDPVPVSQLQPMSSPALDRLVRICLAKDPDQRWQSAHDLTNELKWVAEAGSQAGVPLAVTAKRRSRERLWMLSSLALFVALLAALIPQALNLSDQPGESAPIRFSVPLRENLALRTGADTPVISPDGKRIVFSGEVDGEGMLSIRSLDSLETHPVPRTEGALLPFWSPDGRFIGFFADGKLKKIDHSGGPALALCDAPNPRGGSWSEKGIILFTPSNQDGLYSVAEAGGRPVRVTNLSKGQIGHRWPHFLPGGEQFLCVVEGPERNSWSLYAGSLETKELQPLVSNSSNAMYAPPGYLLFVQQGTLLAQPFDSDGLRLSQQPVPVGESIGRSGQFGLAPFSVSRNGILVHGKTLSLARELAWYDRQGKRFGTLGRPRSYLQLALSPDGKRVAVEVLESQVTGSDIWTIDLSTNIFSRLTSGGSRTGDPVWSPDGKHIVFFSSPAGKRGVFRKPVGGAQAEQLFASQTLLFPEDWVPASGEILFMDLNGRELHALPLSGDRKPRRLVQNTSSTDEVHVSPDGNWVAYNSNESGTWEMYVASYPSFSERRQVSDTGGCQGRWRRDGRELFYLGLDGKMRSVEVKTREVLETGVPKVLFNTRANVSAIFDQYGVTADGQQFLVIEPVDDDTPTITVVVNWMAGLAGARP